MLDQVVLAVRLVSGQLWVGSGVDQIVRATLTFERNPWCPRVSILIGLHGLQSFFHPPADQIRPLVRRLRDSAGADCHKDYGGDTDGDGDPTIDKKEAPQLKGLGVRPCGM